MSQSAAEDQLGACEKFFGLRGRPFSLTPDLRFAFYSRSHSRALEQVTDALRRREGLVVITGEIGVGKTMLCRALLETLDPRTFLSVIQDPCLTVEDLLRRVLTDFGLMRDPAPDGAAPRPEVTRHQLVSTLQQFLATLNPLDAHAVIMIDEAQHLKPEVLEEIRLLSNYESDEAKLLQIVLVGQPDLEEVLRRPEMRQLAQRITRRWELHALSPTEVKDYIERRLFVASECGPAPADATSPDEDDPAGPAERVQFKPAAIQAVAALSHGIPRVVNIVCDRAMEVGFEQQTRTIDRAQMLAAAKRLKIPVPAILQIPRVTPASAAAAALAFAAVVGAFWWTARSGPAVANVAQVERPVPPSTARAASNAAPAVPDRRPSTPPSTTPTPTTTTGVVPAAPAAASPRPAPGTAAKTGSTYEIAVAAFRTAQRAGDVSEAIAEKGLPVSTRTDSAGLWHRIVVGPFASAEEADAAQRLLARDGFSGTNISVTPPLNR